jgi:hypothetical protein
VGCDGATSSCAVRAGFNARRSAFQHGSGGMGVTAGIMSAIGCWSALIGSGALSSALACGMGFTSAARRSFTRQTAQSYLGCAVRKYLPSFLKEER